jgi:preprotein translocase subunit SecG
LIALLTIVHVLICALLVVAVLMQSGKGGGLAGSIGGGLGASSVLGGRTATTFLTKTTTGLATAFLVSCLIQAFVHEGPTEAPMTATERMLAEGADPFQVPFEASVEETPAAPEGSDTGGGGGDQ